MDRPRILIVVAMATSVVAGTLRADDFPSKTRRNGGPDRPQRPGVARTTNFQVEAPTPEIARKVAQGAERFRKERALEWLGQELGPWATPCPLRVTLALTRNGASTLDFRRGAVISQVITVEGPLDGILNGVLPHEITHLVLAHHFGQQVPRWADEGAAAVSSDDTEKSVHEKKLQGLLGSTDRFLPLHRLFAFTGYPDDAMILYAEGYSVTRFLVEQKDRKTFVAFVSQGMRDGWDEAVRRHYKYANVETLEAAWLRSAKNRREAVNNNDGFLQALQFIR